MENNTKGRAGIVLTSKEAYAIANQIALVSSELLRFRVDKQKDLSREQSLLLEKCEDELDANVVEFRNKGIMLLNGEAKTAISEIEAAVKRATKFLKKIEVTEKAIKAAVVLVDLARAILAHDIGGIVETANAVEKAAKA